MRAGGWFLVLLWFASSAYAGYRLTERSFAWIGEPASEAAPAAEPEKAAIDVEELKGLSSQELMEKAKQLSPQQLLCLRGSIAPERVSAVLKGDITPQEAEAARKCIQ